MKPNPGLMLAKLRTLRDIVFVNLLIVQLFGNLIDIFMN